MSRADFARFIEIATGSLFEVVPQAEIARRQHYLDEGSYRRLYDAAATQS